MDRLRQYGGDVSLVNLLLHSEIHRLWMFDSGSRTTGCPDGDNTCGEPVESGLRDVKHML
jgi:hypothetical protein